MHVVQIAHQQGKRDTLQVCTPNHFRDAAEMVDDNASTES